MKIELHSYLNFPGNCKEAFTFYHTIFGGDAPQYSYFRDSPEPMPNLSAAEQGQVMHVYYQIEKGVVLMGSDCPSAMGPVNFGNNVSVSVQVHDPEEGAKTFETLSEGGKVVMPYKTVFWDAKFGMLVDRYGIPWMLNCQLHKEG